MQTTIETDKLLAKFRATREPKWLNLAERVEAAHSEWAGQPTGTWPYRFGENGSFLHPDHMVVRYRAEFEAEEKLKKDVLRRRKNARARARSQVLRDLGLTKTPYGWE